MNRSIKFLDKNTATNEWDIGRPCVAEPVYNAGGSHTAWRMVPVIPRNCAIDRAGGVFYVDTADFSGSLNITDMPTAAVEWINRYR